MASTDVLTSPIQIVIVEDKKKNYSRLIQYILGNLNLELLSIEQFSLNKIRVIENSDNLDYDEIVTILKRTRHKIFIVDINLGGEKEDEGLDILREIKERVYDIKSLVYTGEPNPSRYKDIIGNACDEFIEKGFNHHIKILEFINKCIYGEEFVSRLDDDTEEEDLVKGNRDIDHKDIQLQKENKNSGLINNLDEIDFEDIELKINSIQVEEYSDWNYEEEAFNAQTYFCKSLLQKHELIFHNFLLDKSNIRIDVSLVEDSSSISTDAIFELQQLINQENNNVEGIVLIEKGKYIFSCYIKNLEDASRVSKLFFEQKKSLNLFQKDLLEFFISKRLSELYYDTSEENEQKKIVQLVQKLDKDIGQSEFITNIWEWTTALETNNIDQTNEILESLYNQKFNRIKDIFYGVVIEKLEGIVSTKISSVEDINDTFDRDFNLDFLSKAGVSNESSYFKLIIYQSKKGERTRSDTSYFLEPILPEFYSRKLGE